MRQGNLLRQRGNWRLRSVILSLLAMFLVWEVTTRTFVAYLADVSPETALQLRATDPAALVNVADRQLSRNQAAKPSESPDTFHSDKSADEQASAQIKKWGELALAHDPLNARAFRILGQVAEDASDEQRAEQLMQAAVRRSLRQGVAVYWLVRKSYDNQDYSAATRYADALLRTRPQVIAQVMPILSRIAEREDAKGELKKVLAGNPPWRAQFLNLLPQSISDARTPLDFLLSLKDAANPPTVPEVQSYLNVLISHKFHELAYYTWLQFLPQEQLGNAGLLFNGSFEITPSGLPFDWVIAQGSGVAISIASRPDHDAERALFIEFGHGRVEFRDVTQLVMLSPGSYRFEGKYKGNLVGRRGLQWRIMCAGGTTSPIGESQMISGAAVTWKAFEFSFTVPKTECRAQYVRLVFGARSASERFVSGSIWYDELQIRRAE